MNAINKAAADNADFVATLQASRLGQAHQARSIFTSPDIVDDIIAQLGRLIAESEHARHADRVGDRIPMARDAHEQITREKSWAPRISGK